MNHLIESARSMVRGPIRLLAIFIDTISAGKISPNMITVVGLLMHLPIAYLIALGYFGYAGLGIVVFGLFDALDGELARIQNKSSLEGMFIDSTADRMKEIFIYCGLANVFVLTGASKTSIVVLTAALGVSVLTSYMNAWGEAVVSIPTKTKNHKVNKSFRSGLLSFDLRMLIIVIGLFANQMNTALLIILVLGSITVAQRYLNITQVLRDVQN